MRHFAPPGFEEVKAMKKYYLAYGSNLNVRQMRFRCPNAVPVGTATLDGYRLLFKGSKTGAYLTVERHRGSTVPLGVWEVDETDEKNLDRYEGYPAFYYKKSVKLNVRSLYGDREQILDAFLYIMHEERPIGVPSDFYMDTCLEGYDTFYFDPGILLAAYDKSLEVCGYERE